MDRETSWVDEALPLLESLELGKVFRHLREHRRQAAIVRMVRRVPGADGTAQDQCPGFCAVMGHPLQVMEQVEELHRIDVEEWHQGSLRVHQRVGGQGPRHWLL
jgi:hypothetical protein